MRRRIFIFNLFIFIMISLVIIIGFSCSTPADNGGGGKPKPPSSSSSNSSDSMSSASNSSSSESSSVSSVSSSASGPNAPAGLDLDSGDDTGLSNSDNLTNISTALTITGTADPGVAVILVSDKDGILTTSPAVIMSDASGSWTVDVNLTANMIHNIYAVADDFVQQSPPSETLVIAIDTLVNIPSGLDLDNADDTGASNTDNKTNISSNLTISGTADPNVMIILSSDMDGILATSPSTVISDGSGNWTADVNLTVNKTHGITAAADDTLQQSAASAPLVITIDSLINSPAGLDLDGADDTGASNTDNKTNISSNLTISGTADPDVAIILTSDRDGVLATSPSAVISDGSGNWTADVSLTANMTHSITAVADDSLQQSSASLPLVITIDNQINIPAGLDLDGADDSGSSNADNITNLSAGLTISGTADPFVTITLTSSQDGVLATAPAAITSDGSGNWTADVNLTANLTHSITAAADDSLQQSPQSLPLTIIIDNIANAPAGLDLDGADDSGMSNSDNLTNITTALTISGTADPDVRIILTSSISGVLATMPSTIISDGSGNWTADVSLTANNTHSITAVADDSLQLSAQSAPLVITTDAESDAPSGLDLAGADDSGISDFDNLTYYANNLTISGNSEANATIVLSSSQDGVLATTPSVITANSSGYWTADASLTPDLIHLITARALDYAGNAASADSAALQITVDTKINAPTIVLDPADDSGRYNNDNLTNLKTLTFSGTAESGGSITLSSNFDGLLATVPAAVTADGSGNWTADASFISDNIHTVTVSAEDPAGNIGSNTTNVTIDTVQPNAAITSSSQVRTNMNPIPVTITFSEGINPATFDSSDITVTNGTAGTPATSDNITWTCSITPTAAGALTVTINSGRVDDTAGNDNNPGNTLNRTYITSVGYDDSFIVSGGGSNTVNLTSVAVDNNSNRLLLVEVHGWKTSNGSISNVTATYGGTSMTLIPGANLTNGTDGSRMTTRIFYMNNPPVGTANVQVVFTTSAGTMSGSKVVALSLFDTYVHSGTAYDEVQTYSNSTWPRNTATSSITTNNAYSMVAGIVGGDRNNSNMTATSGQSVRKTSGNPVPPASVATKDTTTAGSTAMNWTFSRRQDNRINQVLAEIRIAR